MNILEMVAFAFTFVIAQSIVGLITVRLILTKGVIKKYLKVITDLTNDLYEEEGI